MLLLVLLPVLCASVASAQDIYKWKDDKGQWHFSQTPPTGATKAVQDPLALKPSPTVAAWYAQEKLHRDVEFLRVALDVTRFELGNCPQKYSLAELQRGVEAAHLKSPETYGAGVLYNAIKDGALWMGCERRKTAETAPPAPTLPVLQIVDVDYAVTEKNSTWWRFSWKLDVANSTEKARAFAARIKFLDINGFILDQDTEAVLHIKGWDRQVYTGFALIRAANAPKVYQANAAITLR